jgi:hypothetical protein
MTDISSDSIGSKQLAVQTMPSRETSILPILGEAIEFIQKLALVAGLVVQNLVRWAEEEQRNHERAAVRRACLRRRQWKVGDVKRLQALPHARFSVKRLARLAASAKRGRPVVQRYRSLPEAIIEFVQVGKDLFDSGTPCYKRLKVLKRTSLWPGFAEALYRGSYEEAKVQGRRSPAVEAEHQAAEQMAISPATLRKLCAQIRRERRLSGDLSGPSMSPTTFARWLKTGDLPDINS